jgi:hypothetical protein
MIAAHTALNINTCSPSNLASVKGCGSMRVASIVIARPFFSWEDVAAVSGVGPALVARLRGVFSIGEVAPEHAHIAAARQAEAARLEAQRQAKADAAFDKLMARVSTMGALGEYGDVEVIASPVTRYRVGGVEWWTVDGETLHADVKGLELTIKRRSPLGWSVPGLGAPGFCTANDAAKWVARTLGERR